MSIGSQSMSIDLQPSRPDILDSRFDQVTI